MTNLFTLEKVRGNNNNIILTIKNCYNNISKDLTFDIASFDLKTICNKFNIFYGDWEKSNNFEFDNNNISDDEIQPYIFTRVSNSYKPIPIFQLRKNELSEFIYRLFVYKYNSIDRIKTNYARCSYKDIKLTKKQYLRQVFNEYCLLRRHYFNDSYYNNQYLRNLNKIVVRMLYNKLFK